MGLAWQQGPLAPGAVGAFLVPEPLPARLLYAKPPRRRVRLMFGGQSIAESDDAVLQHEPGRYPVAYFPTDSVRLGGLVAMEKRTNHRDLGETTWFEVQGRGKSGARGAWEHTALPPFARVLADRVAVAWRSRGGRWTAFMKRRSSHADPADLVAKIQDPSLAQSECLGLNARRQVRNASSRSES